MRGFCNRDALVIGCLYEVAAITTRKVPTITQMVQKLGGHKFGKFVCWCWVGYVAWHFLEPLAPCPALTTPVCSEV